ncbi:hypothetical protein F4802DRAFT_575670 [Xylaria palmicola]|nr:hypothetical protein F4802DRAFT_575670 [Xylaria palmicola]
MARSRRMNNTTVRLLPQQPLFGTSSETTYSAWISAQSENISNAFDWQKKIKPSDGLMVAGCQRDLEQHGDAEDADVGSLPVELLGTSQEDAIFTFTTLLDSETGAEPLAASSPVASEDENPESEDDDMDNSTTAPQVADSPIISSLEATVQRGMRVDDKDDCNKTWKIDNRGHLIVQESLLPEAVILRDAPPEANTLAPSQSEAVARLAAQGRQLEAFQHALQCAAEEALDVAAGVQFEANVGLDNPYPTIDLVMAEWRPDTELQCYVAYYILRGMLKRYGSFPFPDRVVVRELGPQLQERLLVPYGEGGDDAGSEAARVRRMIVEELWWRGI